MVVVVFAMALKWELRRRVWFWAVILTVVAMHLLLILSVPWTTRWISALVMTPIAAADVAGIVALITILEKPFGKATPREN
jgi:hypothetical protein